MIIAVCQHQQSWYQHKALSFQQFSLFLIISVLHNFQYDNRPRPQLVMILSCEIVIHATCDTTQHHHSVPDLLYKVCVYGLYMSSGYETSSSEQTAIHHSSCCPSACLVAVIHEKQTGTLNNMYYNARTTLCVCRQNHAPHSNFCTRSLCSLPLSLG